MTQPLTKLLLTLTTLFLLIAPLITPTNAGGDSALAEEISQIINIYVKHLEVYPER